MGGDYDVGGRCRPTGRGVVDGLIYRSRAPRGPIFSHEDGGRKGNVEDQDRGECVGGGRQGLQRLRGIRGQDCEQEPGGEV